MEGHGEQEFHSAREEALHQFELFALPVTVTCLPPSKDNCDKNEKTTYLFPLPVFLLSAPPPTSVLSEFQGFTSGPVLIAPKKKKKKIICLYCRNHKSCNLPELLIKLQLTFDAPEINISFAFYSLFSKWAMESSLQRQIPTANGIILH